MKNYVVDLVTDRRNEFMDQVLKIPLWGLSKIFHGVTSVRSGLYHYGSLPVRRLPVPVICVGNITWGGVGKTPLVEVIARGLEENGFRPAILTRGYMADSDALSDEAQMLRRSLPDLPVLIGANRYQQAQAYLKDHQVGVFLMDDGYQHRQLYRTLDIVVIDAVNPWGNGYLLPRGILREPLSSLRRASLIILTRSDHQDNRVSLIRNRLSCLGIQAPIFLTRPQYSKGWDIKSQQDVSLEDLKGQAVISTTSIGQPERFGSTLDFLKIHSRQAFMFEDHHSYTRGDIEQIKAACQKHQVSLVLTTMKDAVKLETLLEFWPDSIRLVALQYGIQFMKKKDDFFAGIFSAIRG